MGVAKMDIIAYRWIYITSFYCLSCW